MKMNIPMYKKIPPVSISKLKRYSDIVRSSRQCTEIINKNKNFINGTIQNNHCLRYYSMYNLLTF